jgi:class 3 adenylate cyclase
MRQAAEAVDAAGLRLAALSLKSNSADLGATTLSDLCWELEAMGKADTLERAAEKVAQAEEEYERVKAALAAEKHGHILVVDDNRLNRLKLSRGLEQQGHTVALAENGRQALEMIQTQSFDLVLLDIIMPEMDGYQVLEHIKKCDSTLRDIPVIVISALDEMESVVKCIEMGAEDYLPKPFDPVLLKARIGASLEKKWLRDQEQAYLKQLQIEREKSERLLLNILPKPIADRLKQGESIIADSFPNVTVLFADIVGFTKLSAHVAPKDLVIVLNEIFSTMDRLAEKHGLEKIKTLGDAYMVVGGLPTPRPDHVEAVAEMALDMQGEITPFFKLKKNDQPLRMRIGIHTGPVVAGVIGTKRFSYDLWGDTVNIASRMESHGLSGRIQVTATTYERLRDKYLFEERGMIQVKGKGEMKTYFLIDRKTD